jgi:hypothetical protein
MEAVITFFNQPIFILLGGLSTLLTLIAAVYVLYLVLRGVVPVLFRLGMGLSRRKIAVFAEDEFKGLTDMLVDSGLFQESNVIRIDKGSIKKAEGMTLFLLHWKSFESEIEKILAMKDDTTALVVYAPSNEGPIDKTIMEKINQERNSIVVNLRGRLLNDILVSMITTGYKK